MGTRGRQIVSLDIKKLIELLNKAYADEWLAYYQYWVGAQVIEGPMRDAAIKELMQHANDELRHADMVAKRIIELGGTPILSPDQWYKVTNCGYAAPEDPFIQKVIDQNIKGEQCAIDVYDHLMKFTKDDDSVTYHIAEQILADEIEHEEDLEMLLNDINLIKKLK